MRFGVTFHQEYTWWWWQTAFGSDEQGDKKGVPYDGNLTLADGKGKWWEGYDPSLLYGINLREYKGVKSAAYTGWSPPPAGIFSNHIDYAKWYTTQWALRMMDVVEKYDPDFIYTDGTVQGPFTGNGTGTGVKADAMQRVMADYYNRTLGRRGKVDTFSIADGSRNVVVDHCSASWSIDETLSPSGDISDVTVQWCIISESLNNSLHSKGPHGYGSLLRATGGVSLHHNLWSHHNGRNPRFGDNYAEGPFPTFDFRNNVIYNWGSYCSGMTDGNIRVNYVANFLKPGPSSSRRNPIAMGDGTPETRFHISGNVVEGRQSLTDDNTRLFDKTESGGRPLYTLIADPFDTPAVTTVYPNDAYLMVLDQAGATVPVRDAVDERIVRDVREGTGRIIDSQQDVGGWPEYQDGTVPADTDEDGMPDEWEISRGLDPLDAADGSAITESGYTNLETYLDEAARRFQWPGPVDSIARAGSLPR
jgi:hypothetical protein